MKRYRLKPGVSSGDGNPDWLKPGVAYPGKWANEQPPRDPPWIELRDVVTDGWVLIPSTLVEEVE
jgi:hypothetical protein